MFSGVQNDQPSSFDEGLDVGGDVENTDAAPADIAQPDVSHDAAVTDADLDFGSDLADTSSLDWWDEAWSYRVAVTFSATVVAAGVPIPLRIPSSVVDLVVDDGTDLRVVDPLGQPVEFERARWDDAPVVWVSMDVDPSVAGPHLFLYFGGPDGTSDVSDNQMWSDSLGVFHFDAAGVGRNTTEPDWTAQFIGDPTAVEGLVGDGLDAGAGTLRYQPGQNTTNPLNILPGEKASFTACFVTEPAAAPQMLAWKEGGCLGWSLRVQVTGEVAYRLGHGSSCSDSQSDLVASPMRFDDGQWHCVTARVDRDTGLTSLTVDGEHVASGTVDTQRDASGGTFRIGDNYNNTAPMLGLIDEVWLFDDWPSNEWVETTHAAMLGDLTSFGPVEQRP